MPALPEHNVVRLKCAAGNLLIVQSQVQGIAPALDAEVGDNGIGEVGIGGTRWPLFVLDQNLLPDAGPGEFRFCVGVRDDDGGAFALACDAFDMLEVSDLDVRALPGCMRNEHTPFDALVRVADEAGLFLNLSALRRHLESLAQ